MSIVYASNNYSPDGSRVFIHASAGDEEYRDRIASVIEEIDKGEFVPCWSDDSVDVFSGNYPAGFSQMSLAVLAVSKKYLDTAEKTSFSVSDFLKSTGIAVIPVIESSELVPRFTELFGKLHAIIIGRKSWQEELEKQIERKLIGNELRKEIIEGAFDGKMFLSYRKKDIEDALRIMRAVHDTAAASAYEIWYDDFLSPGEDFNDGIADALKACDIFLLSVTPSLTELNARGERNYVQAKEFPAAKDCGKPIIPVEAKATDRASVETGGFEGVPEFVSCDDRAKLNQRISEVCYPGNAQEKRSSRAVYLLSMAFYLGIHVEKDVPRAIGLLDTAANMGSCEAAEELSRIYALGLGTEANADKSIEYLQKSFQIAENLTENSLSKARLMYRAVLGRWEGRYMIAKTHAEEADYCDRLLAVLEACLLDASEDQSDEICFMLAEAVMNIGNLESGPVFPNQSAEDNVRYAIKKLKEGKEYLDCCENKRCSEYYRLSAVYYSLYSSALRSVALHAKAIDCALKAMDWQEDLIRHFDSSYEARLQLASYTMNAGGCRFNYLYPHLKEHFMDADSYLQPALTLVEQAAEEYEKLYDERRQLSCGLEAALCFCNLTFVNTDMKQNRKYLQRGQALLDRVEKDYPNAPGINEYRNKLTGRY